MSEWLDIESAPKDGTVVRAGRLRPGSIFWPSWPIPARFIDGKWKMRVSGGWSSYDPQPNVWQPCEAITMNNKA